MLLILTYYLPCFVVGLHAFPKIGRLFHSESVAADQSSDRPD